jgi:catechol 2,3-dioxygenase-like lactoylglutathione lyase family enzyme
VTDAQDLEAVKAELEGAGVTIENGPGMRSGARGNAMSIYFRDPDDNMIELRTYDG